MSLWILEKSILVSPKSFNEEILFNDSHDLSAQMLGITKSKFDTFNVFSSCMEGYENIHAYAILSDGEINFPELGISHHVGRGDFVAYRTDLVAEIGVHSIKHVFSCNDSPRVFGDGPNTYEVTATIRDDYKITINANSNEEAIRIADQVPISEWRHPDVLEDSHLEDRRVIRHARWGNLSAVEIKE
jgi:hypothetical protein